MKTLIAGDHSALRSNLLGKCEECMSLWAKPTTKGMFTGTYRGALVPTYTWLLAKGFPDKWGSWGYICSENRFGFVYPFQIPDSRTEDFAT